MYITEQDYINIGGEALKIVQQGKEENRLLAERFAMDFAAGYLRGRYDVDAAFSREGDERNMALVGCLTDIALYRMALGLPARMSLEKYSTQYDKQVEWLAAVPAPGGHLGTPPGHPPPGQEN